MKLSAEQFQAKGFAYYRAPAAAGAGRTFEAVAKSHQDFEVQEVSSSQSTHTAYSPPVNPSRSGVGLFQSVANSTAARAIIDLYV
jgi:hypothetical protein